jgi:hypothetical protein
MTIAAGFRADGGVVLAADTQETIPDYLKTDTSKITTFQRMEEFRVALTGAGGSDMIQMIYQTFMDRFFQGRKWNYISVEQAVRDVVYEAQLKHVLPYPAGERPNFQLLIAVQMKGEKVRLLRSIDTTVRRVEDFSCVGEIALAHYAAGEVEFSQMPVCFARSYAIYMLNLVKKFSPNCGEQTEVVVLYDDWDAEILSQNFIRMEEMQIERISSVAKTLTVNSFAHRDTEERLQTELDHLKEHIVGYRKWEVEHSGENCKLTDQLVNKATMIAVGKHGIAESKASALRRKAEKKKSLG